MTRSESYTVSAVVLLFPLTWFFNFLYYTDGGSTTFVLVSWLAALKGKHSLSALGLIIALSFRQTNIIWALFILGTSLLNIATPEERRRFDPQASTITSPLDVLTAVLGFVEVLLKHLGLTIATSSPYLGLLAIFGIFVKWNGGIVLAFAAFVTWAVYSFTYVHPFLLADNRHYTFYITRILLLRSWVVRYLAVPFYMMAAWLMWQSLAAKRTILWCIIYVVATALTLVPTPLVEFRYFIVPYLVYRLSMRQSRGVWLLLEAGLYSAINLVTMYLFLYRPFRWVHAEGVQRFMW
ncbi:glucosyltransferase [Actinomortierella wolfii]|nr:glucosyltransferase [Actinomortierella wolfii]